ncbi:MAG: transcriptional regulator, GntR family [Ilumatobacteraceae bacterium]|nr:transcriptional regulator, GntR family [Ilumatobacteraceae bacterium]
MARFVRTEIFEGRLAAGQRLPQDDIAESVGVSRIPVREAIIALEREGWVRVERHRGAFINALDEQAVLDRFALYGRFYGFAARRALERMTADERQTLRGLALDLTRPTGAKPFERANSAYMSTLVHFAGSARLRGVLRSTAQIVPGNFFATVPKGITIQRAGIAALQAALDADDASAAEQICADMEHRHALEVIAVMHSRQARAATAHT